LPPVLEGFAEHALHHLVAAFTDEAKKVTLAQVKTHSHNNCPCSFQLVSSA